MSSDEHPMEIETADSSLTVRPAQYDCRDLRGAFQLALFCWIFPLVAGVSIFVLWVITRWDWLMLAGGITLFGGTIFFLAGCCALFRYCVIARRTTPQSSRRIWTTAGLCGALLLSNFVVAGGIIVAFEAILTCNTVRIHNASEKTATDAQLLGRGYRIFIGTIPPHTTVQRSVWVSQEGELTFHVQYDSQQQHAIVDGYVSPGIEGGHKTVTLQLDGTISVADSYAM